MASEIPSILHHLSIGTGNLESARRFYDAVMATIGARRIMEFPFAVAYGKRFPEFWVAQPLDGSEASVGSGTHVCFIAPSREAVGEFHAAGIAAGGSDDGAPGPRPEYGPAYYACFLRDPDGHKVEAAIVPDVA